MDGPVGFTQLSALHLALHRWTRKFVHIAGSETRTVQDPILKRGTSNCLIIRPATRTRPTLQTLLPGRTRSVPRTHPAPRRLPRQPRLRFHRSLLKRETMALARATVGFGSS